MTQKPRCHVSTRKGLFTLERGGNGWAIARANFVGDNVTLAMHDPRSGDLVAALNHGHFGNKLHRSTRWRRDLDGDRGAEVSREARRTTNQQMPVEGAPVVDWSLKLIWALEPGGADRAGRDLVRHAAGRTVQVGGWRRFVGARSRRCGTTRAASSGSAAAPISRASTRSASTRAIRVT